MTRFALALCLAVLASGCGLFGGSSAPVTQPAGEPELPPGPVSFVIQGAPSMNAGGNAARVYLYPLSSDATFRATPVQAFWEAPETTLATDLVGTVRDATVRPGASMSLDAVTLGGAPFLGIAADLREPDGDTWRAVLTAAQVRGKAVRVTVSEGGIQVVTR